jgi:hypothetical protein
VVGAVVVLATETGKIVVHRSASRTQQKRELYRKSIGTQELT